MSSNDLNKNYVRRENFVRSERNSLILGKCGPLFYLVFIIIFVCLLFIGCGNSSDDSNSESTESSDYQQQSIEDGKTITRDEAINNHWDEIKVHLNGTEAVEATSTESGSTYDLEADISNGEIETIHFNNGGYLNFSAEIDDDGQASDVDKDGNNWDFTLDMNSPIVDDAINDWASSSGYTIVVGFV